MERWTVTNGLGLNKQVIVSPYDEYGRARSPNQRYAHACKLAVPTNSRSSPEYKWLKAKFNGYAH